VTRFSSKTGITVALSPWAAVDMALSLWSNIKMIDEIGQVYGVRPSFINRIAMLKNIIGHLAVAGASELAVDQILEEVGGASIASHFSVRLSQGLGVGLYSAKIGLATMTVSRPMEFIDNKPDLKSLTRLLVEQFKSQFK
jgi:putative membrane protein